MNASDLELLKKIGELSNNMTEKLKRVERKELFNNSETFNNCMFTLKQIGSNVAKLSEEFTEKYALEFDWEEMARMKHIFEFFQTGYNRNTIWQIIMRDVPALCNVTDEIYKKEHPSWLSDLLKTS
jgi:uncharacterized protein with HEPN domain